MSAFTVSQLQVKSYDAPDEQRRPDKTAVDILNLGDYTLGRFTFEPGWRWSECIKPVVNTESCQNNHVGYCISGSIEVEMSDGTRTTIKAGDSYTIPAGHDARVVGDEPFRGIEFLSAASFAKSSGEGVTR
ncbi:cupin domain-containing protein [Arthrobacter mobilis]|uniref:Cupin domain-containing protein n=1 Tax=Arthrobacter mobilis TaxID=2724944 RepID=A0A7X6K4K4_9MICC|nr:cupin domain-containing protein [Arthrobacter mobilis]NKX54730.1 cupin domain-containing protein [Arthrobacter mobilis]